MPKPPLTYILEFARAEQTADPYGFRFAPQDYLLRTAGGGFKQAHFSWDQGLREDLDAVRRPGSDPVVLARLGERLRMFLEALGWGSLAEKIQEACRQGHRVYLTFRSAAAELYSLPWELLTLNSAGQHVGELPGVLLRYEWPETSTISEQPPPGEKGRILLAWSAAGGAVPAAAHMSAIVAACKLGAQPFDSDRDTLAHVSLARLSATLAAAQRDHLPISVLHLLAHGGAAGDTFGIVLDDEPAAGASAVTVDAGRLRQILMPYANMVRLVVLMACDSGNIGVLGNQLGSVAQTLHRAGIASVVASRYPLSVAGSIRLAESLYRGLFQGPDSLESALLTARAELALDASSHDWASIQLYARAADGQVTRPLVFRAAKKGSSWLHRAYVVLGILGMLSILAWVFDLITLSERMSSQLIYIPTGEYVMGSTNGESDEKPHKVKVDSFIIQKTEVTVSEYRACVESDYCTPAGIDDKFCNFHAPDRNSHPINCVSWEQANTYCHWIRGRLPSEEQWEFAARGTDGRIYPWGNEFPKASLLNACGIECANLAKKEGRPWNAMYQSDDGWPTTAVVGSYPMGQSPFGILDMAGNVWEWTESYYCEDYDKKCTQSAYRVLRGGSWISDIPQVVRMADRFAALPNSQFIGAGFRCVFNPDRPVIRGTRGAGGRMGFR